VYLVAGGGDGLGFFFDGSGCSDGYLSGERLCVNWYFILFIQPYM